MLHFQVSPTGRISNNSMIRVQHTEIDPNGSASFQGIIKALSWMILVNAECTPAIMTYLRAG